MAILLREVLEKTSQYKVNWFFEGGGSTKAEVVLLRIRTVPACAPSVRSLVAMQI